jgi:apolipoprotein D and lipocalin family protein
MMSKMFPALAACAVLMGASVAQATPEPRRSLDLDRFMGRWHEILRTPNLAQRDCWAASQVWSKKDDGSFSILQSCHKGSRAGPVKTFDTKARVLDTATNAKFEATFFGGLIHRKYWVVDIAPDYSWMIATTADGKYPALLSRTADMTAAKRSELVARMSQLGLPTDQLEPSGSPSEKAAPEKANP